MTKPKVNSVPNIWHFKDVPAFDLKGGTVSQLNQELS
jgi:hypothetical protein